MMFTTKTYDVLKWIAQILLPALGTLYFAVAGVWGLPYAEQVVGTIMAIDAFLGVILGLSSARYNKNFPDGIVTPTPDQTDESLKLQSKIDYEATIQKMKERD